MNMKEMSMHNKPGFILITTFFLLASASAILMLTARKEYVHARLTSTLVIQHTLKDTIYALLNCTPALFYGAKEEDEEKKSEKQKDASTLPDIQKLIKMYIRYAPDFAALPKFSAPQQQDPFSGYLKISCESGKLNLNGIYDFTKKDWRNEKQKKFCAWLFEALAKQTQTENCFADFETYLKNRGCHFNDISELYEIEKIRNTFVNNFAPVYKKQTQKTDAKMPLYFSELFTVQTETDTINALCLTPSMVQLLGGQFSTEGLQKIDFKQIMQAIQNKNQQDGISTICKDLYNITFETLPLDCKSLLTMNSELNIFAIAVTLLAQNVQTSMLAVVKIMPDKEKIGTLEIMKVYQT